MVISKSVIVDYQRRIQDLLKLSLPDSHTLLHQAMRYSVLNGGKRWRPLLVYGAGEVINAPLERLDVAAIAVECIHTFSLIHDDLPAMDNDDFRRGKLSCHKRFDEATAILAGDGLQSMAFEILARNQDIKQMILLAKAIGAQGMTLGQSEDMNYKNQIIDQEALYRIHRLKTGRLITASVQLGAMCGDCPPDIFEYLTRFAENFGLAFQLRDDFLDEQEDKNKVAYLKQQAEVFFEAAKADLRKIASQKNNLLTALTA